MEQDQAMTTPAAAGFRMPFEGVRHERSWMAWPCREAIWNGRMDAAKRAYAAVARAIAGCERIVMLANQADLAEARETCGPAVEIRAMPLDDSWMRDIGPTFVVDAAGTVAGNAWSFNCWGEKMPPWDKDAEVSRRVLDALGLRRFDAPFVLEGGSIHVDGEGTLLTSEQCLLNPNRNPSLTRAGIEENLRQYLGVRTIVWLGEGLENDGTDGHVDNLACFAAPGTVLAATCADPADANHAPLADNLRRLKSARDARGRAFEVIELPIPAARGSAAGRLALNYVNFYLANGAVIAPSFDDPMDSVAAERLARAFPDRRIVQVPALAILEGGGGIHCITQQQPASA
jgi:agmatine deiminase